MFFDFWLRLPPLFVVLGVMFAVAFVGCIYFVWFTLALFSMFLLLLLF